MTTPTLDPHDARLTDYALGELDDADRADVEQLLAASPELQSELADIQGLAASLRSELAQEPVLALTSAQRDVVTRQAASIATPLPLVPLMPLVESTPKPPRKWTARHWLLAGAEASAAALFMIVVWRFSPYQPIGWSSRGIIACPEISDYYDTADRSAEATSYPLVMPQEMMEFGRGVASTPLAIQSGSELAGLSESSSLSAASSGGTVHDLSSDQSESSRRSAPLSGKPLPTALNLVDSESKSNAPANAPRLAEPEFDNVASGRMSAAAKAALIRRYGGNPSEPGPKFRPGEARPYATKPTDGRVTHELESRQPDSRLHFSEREVEEKLAEVASRGSESKYSGLERVPQPTAQPDPQTNEAYEAPAENGFLTPVQQPLSTFSIDVDSASYANVRRFLTQGQLPPPDAVRIEEMINYFTYDYPQPKDGEPFSVTADAAPCPWQREHYLARIALKARTIDKAKRPPTNLVFLLDVSGSMQAANKLPLVKQAMTMLAEELNERDRIAIVTYAGNAGVQLASTPGNDQVRIMQAIEALQAGGSTNGAAGINLAYEQALQNFNGEGENRVLLCTDGDFNVGVSSDEQLVQLIQQQAKSKVFLSIFGFGMGNLKDAKLEKLADKGNGHYGYIDDLKEARRVFNEELVGTLYTVAKDVKIQVEFNPLTVGAYRLIGYENRALAARDFNDDTKDAGEIGAGHTVTALYEIVPRAQWPKTQAVDALKYGNAAKEPAPAVAPPNPNIPADVADDLFTVKLRYKQPTADTSVKTIDYVVDDIAGKNVVPSTDFQWAASVASFGMQLKHSQFAGQWTLNDVLETAQGAKGTDANGRRREFLDLIQTARRLKP